MRLCGEPMSNRNYREKAGGARLEEVWHASIEGCAELGDVMSARGLSSI
jgi:23S rRNA G2445 N2-methylase RlmL